LAAAASCGNFFEITGFFVDSSHIWRLGSTSLRRVYRQLIRSMHRKPNNLIAASFVAACAFALAGTAQAGYVASDVASALSLPADETVPGSNLRWSDFQGGAGASRPAAKAPPIAAQVSLARHAQYFNFVGIQTGTGGMTAPSADSGGQFAPLAVLFDQGAANAQLVAWLGPDGRAWLPPPFSSGVFRPPRCMA
jgi:hypothetical protein